MQTSSALPATIGKYQIRGILGRGAMGVVLDGWDPVIGRRVAIKTVRLLDNTDAEAREALARFKNEAQAAGRLSHANIVAVHDYGEIPDCAYIVMEAIQGRSLKQMLDAGERLPVAEILRIMARILAALQFSHDRGVIHRDIKPGNVLIAEDGAVKLTDFGIARIESSVITQAGTMLGTPAYMSPEQLMAQSVDARSDVYSAGVLLYQLLTGERPFEGGLTAIIHKVLNTEPPHPSQISVTAPPSLDPVVATAMARRPDDRYPSAAAFADAVQLAYQAADAGSPGAGRGFDADETILLRPSLAATPTPTLSMVPARGARKSNPALLGGAAALLVLVGGAAWLVLQPPSSGPASVADASVASAKPPRPVAGAAADAPAAEPPGDARQDPPAPAGTALPAEGQKRQPDPAAFAALPPSPGAASPVAQDDGVPPQAEPSGNAPEQLSLEPARPAAEHLAIASPNKVALRAALASLGRSAHCALPRFSVSDGGGISVAGLVGADGPTAALRDAVQAAAPDAVVTWGARSVDGPYCDVLDVIRPIAQPSNPLLGLTLKDDATRLKEHDPILPIIKLPEFPAYLQVDYFSHDGSVAHLFPTRNTAHATLPANDTVLLGNSPKGRMEVGPPFGTDVIVAIASSAALLPRVRDDETARIYLPVLQAAIDAARRRNVRLTARALVLETVER